MNPKETDWIFHNIIQKYKLEGYLSGIDYQIKKQPIQNYYPSRIKLPICENHEIDALSRICKKCGMLEVEIMYNEF